MRCLPFFMPIASHFGSQYRTIQIGNPRTTTLTIERKTVLVMAFFFRDACASDRMPIVDQCFRFGRLPRIFRNSSGSLKNGRFRYCRSASVADGSNSVSICRPAMSEAFALSSGLRCFVGDRRTGSLEATFEELFASPEPTAGSDACSNSSAPEPRKAFSIQCVLLRVAMAGR
jgi:hypothetical protein